MKDTLFLVLNIHGFVRSTRRWPSLAREEIAVKLIITASDHSFRSPVLSAELDIQEGQVIQPSIEIVAQEIEQELDQ